MVRLTEAKKKSLITIKMPTKKLCLARQRSKAETRSVTDNISEEEKDTLSGVFSFQPQNKSENTLSIFDDDSLF